MKIVIAGDFSLSPKAETTFKDAEAVGNAFQTLSPIIQSADFSFVNLESPVTESEKPILKEGPALRNSSTALDCITQIGFKGVTLANNHMKDYGSVGLMDTIEGCDKYGLRHIGAGKDIEAARKPLIINGDKVIGFINVCEQEFSIASENEAGCAPLDLINLYEDISALKKQVDRLIVIVHGGSEHYRYPTPRMQKTYRHLVNIGADVVVNHHQHCFSGYEEYNGGLIVYGLGNFFFERASMKDDRWNYGYLLELNITDRIDFKLIPYEQCNGDLSIRLLKDRSHFYREIEDINAVIINREKLNEEYDRYVSGKRPLSPYFPINLHYIRALYNRGYISSLLSQKQKLAILNSIRCESHRDVIIKYLS